MHLKEFLGNDRVLHEEILRRLIDTAKPRLMDRQGHTGDSLHPRLVARRQQLDDRHPVPDDQAIRTRHLNAAGQRLLDRRKEAKQDKSHENRKQRQRRPKFLALEIAPDEREEFHLPFHKQNQRQVTRTHLLDAFYPASSRPRMQAPDEASRGYLSFRQMGVDAALAPAYIPTMQAAIELNQMTLPEKLHLMEALWDELCRREEEVPVPDWHREILDERERQLAEGKAAFADWEVAKERITQRIR